MKLYVLCFSLLFHFLFGESFRVKRIVTKTLTKHSDLNLPCDTSMDCRPIAYVCSSTNLTCQCAERYRANFELNTCLAEVGERCEVDTHCIFGAFCNALKQCECELDNLTPTAEFQCSSAGHLIVSSYLLFLVLSIIRLFP